MRGVYRRLFFMIAVVRGGSALTNFTDLCNLNSNYAFSI